MGQNNKIIQEQKESIEQLLEPKFISDKEALIEFRIKKQFDFIEVKDHYILIKHRNQIAIWNYKNKKRKSIFIQEEIKSACISYDNYFLACIQKESKQLYIMNRTKKIIKIIKLNFHKINGPNNQIKFTKDNQIILISFYILFLMNFTNDNFIICDLGQVSFLIFDYCPINNIVILPIKENIQVWNLFDGEKIIQKDKQVQMTGDVIIQISQSGDQFLLNSEQTGQLKIYDIDLQRKQIICVKNIQCPLKIFNISWIQEDCYIIIDDGFAFIILQVDIYQPIIGKFQKQQNSVSPWLVYLNQRYTLWRFSSFDQIVALRLQSIDIYSIKL